MPDSPGSLRDRLRVSANSDAYSAALDAMPASLVGMQGTIGGLFIAPVKSAGMLQLRRALISPKGLQTKDGQITDRGVMLAIRKPTPTYDFVRLTQREIGFLALLQPRYYNETVRILCYEVSGENDSARQLEISFATLRSVSGEIRRVKMGSDAEVLNAVLAGPKERITLWFRAALERLQTKIPPQDIFVLRRPEEFQREVPLDPRLPEAAQTLFSDGDQIHVTSASTVEWMNAGIQQENGATSRIIEEGTFRGNLRLLGLPPCAEDLISSIEISDGRRKLPLLLTRYCPRCDTIRTDQTTGEKPDTQPLKWLSRNRPHREDLPNKATFGVYGIFPKETWYHCIAEGMTFTITSERD